MAHKEIQQQLRILAQAPALKAEDRIMLDHIADKYDPPRPEPGPVVWWRSPYMPGWEIAKVHQTDSQLMGIYNLHGDFIPLDTVQWKQAHILGPGQVAVNVPPVSEWPEGAGQILAMYCTVTSARIAPLTQVITRAEAERMEVER